MASPKKKSTTEPRCAAIAKRLATARKLVSRLEEQLQKAQAAEDARAKAKADKLRARHERELERTRKRQERERAKAGVADRCTVPAPRARRQASTSKSAAPDSRQRPQRPAYLLLKASVNGSPAWSWRPMGAKRSKGTGFATRDAALASLKAAGYVEVDPPAGPPRPVPTARSQAPAPSSTGDPLDELLRATSSAEMEGFIQNVHDKARELQRAGKDAEYERLMRQAQPFLDRHEQLVVQESQRSRRRKDTSTGSLFGN